MKVPSNDDLECLNGWPESTNGYITEKTVIETINGISKIIGYGRMLQIVQGIHDIWRDEEKISEFQEWREKRLEKLKECFLEEE